MGIEMLVEEFRRLLKLIEIEYENSEKKIVISKDTQRLTLPGQIYENLKKGTTLSIARWIIPKLVEAGLVEREEKSNDLMFLKQLEWKEKNNPRELQEVSRYFYLEMKQEYERDPQLKSILMDIISLRLHKIIGFAAKRIDPSLIQNLTREEEVLYQTIRSIVDEWLRYVSPSGG
ncbi:MAG: hypothetical protein QW655_06585 [Nitrososphaerota archaeon]|nr:hypothetical protein [Candidatus Geocrenenecus dongiae]